MTNNFLHPDYQALFGKFKTEGSYYQAGPLGLGHINDTILIRTKETFSPDYVFQRINNKIFPDVQKLMENIERVTTHLKNKLPDKEKKTSFNRVLILVPAIDGNNFYADENNNCWRCYVYCNNIFDAELQITPKKAYEGGKAVGEFQALLSDLPGGPLHEILRGFHNISKRLKIFYDTLKSNPLKRTKNIKLEIEKILDRADEMKKIVRLGKEGKIPLRITHNDTKFDNILFDNNEHAICLIDIDTVMNGYVHYDFGDAVRTLINTAAEDESELEKIGIDMLLFERFSEGYLEKSLSFLNADEVNNLAFSCKLLTYTIALRFLTDYIAGDIYYKTEFEEHNLQRAKAQLRLLECMEENFEEMEKIIRGRKMRKL